MLITNTYMTPAHPVSLFSRLCPTAAFYWRTLSIVCQAAWRTRKGYSNAQWIEDSRTFIRYCEASGLRFLAENVYNYTNLPGPCVIVANHMSTLETFCLPGLLSGIRPISFVLKRSLTTYPIFGRVVNVTQPIVVDRVNAREDFKVVMEQGLDRLQRGLSVIVFPQTTRTPSLDRQAFNTIGIKLAKKAGVPVLPLALKTDAWGTGRLFKDFGPIHPQRRVHFCFGSPLTIHGPGKNEHEEVVEFISWKLAGWSKDA
ncbi:MAG: lysophospholipid acyltransferase family protein [Desulfomicrobium sp.]|nr:lysophospholipid acyltransferase family protein [Desulfomicrobium sp.]